MRYCDKKGYDSSNEPDEFAKTAALPEVLAVFSAYGVSGIGGAEDRSAPLGL